MLTLGVPRQHFRPLSDVRDRSSERRETSEYEEESGGRVELHDRLVGGLGFAGTSTW